MTLKHIFWLVIVLILIALPVLQMMPSPKQKLRAKLREAAIKAGLLVQFAKIPLPEPPRAESSGTERGPSTEESPGIAYRWQRPPEDKRQFKTHITYRVQLHVGESGYRWFNPKLAPDASCHQALEKIFQNFPDDVAVLESTPTEISAYWRERGDENDVRRIADCLRAIHDVELAVKK